MKDTLAKKKIIINYFFLIFVNFFSAKNFKFAHQSIHLYLLHASLIPTLFPFFCFILLFFCLLRFYEQKNKGTGASCRYSAPMNGNALPAL